MSFFREQVTKRFTRSSGWSKVRKEHVEKHPTCAGCGSKKSPEVHHIRDFSTSVADGKPELELDPNNLLTLCAKRCHFFIGHLLDYKSINPSVEHDAALILSRIRNRRKLK